MKLGLERGAVRASSLSSVSSGPRLPSYDDSEPNFIKHTNQPPPEPSRTEPFSLHVWRAFDHRFMKPPSAPSPVGEWFGLRGGLAVCGVARRAVPQPVRGGWCWAEPRGGGSARECLSASEWRVACLAS